MTQTSSKGGGGEGKEGGKLKERGGVEKGIGTGGGNISLLITSHK